MKRLIFTLAVFGLLATSSHAQQQNFPGAGGVSYFNVKSYGAVGNGVANDTTAINAAITAISTSGGCLFFPQGTYNISATLTIAQPMCVLGSSQSGSTVFLNASSNASVFTVTSSNVFFSDLTIDGNGANQTGGFWKGIDFATGLTKETVQNVTVKNAASDCIYMISDSTVLVQANTLIGCGVNSGGTRGHGFDYETTNSTNPSNVTVINNFVDLSGISSHTGALVGIFVDSFGTNGTLTNVSIEGNTVAVPLAGFETDCIVVAGVATFQPNNVNITGNAIQTTTGSGTGNLIEISQTTNAQVSGNVGFNGNVGILANNSSTGVLYGNSLLGQGNANSPTGIVNTSNLTIGFNRVSGFVSTTNVTATCCLIQDVTASTVNLSWITQNLKTDTVGNPTWGLNDYTLAVTPSPQECWSGSYQNAGTPTFAQDKWCAQVSETAGLNGNSILSFTHTGSTVSQVSIPSNTIIGGTTTLSSNGNITTSAGVRAGSYATSTANHIFGSTTAPTIAGAGCGGSAATIASSNGTFAFTIGVGTAPGSACTITLPAGVTTGWVCFGTDQTTPGTSDVKQTAGSSSTTSVTLTNFNSTLGTAANFTANDVVVVSCHGI